MGRRRPKYLRPKRTTYAIVVDGETEVWYFQMLKRNETGLQINIEPKIPQKKSLYERYEKVIELAEDFTKVFWIIDLDDVIEKNRRTKKGGKGQIQFLKECFDILKKDYGNVIPVINNPCFEYWFVLHYEQTTKYFDKCLKAENYLKKYLKDYEKTRKYFTKQNSDIYLRLKPYLKSAIINAKKTGEVNFDDIEKGLSGMNIFFETEKIKNILL